MKLDQVRIVLVGTTHPGNIGSAARAMKTMGLSELHLVAPELLPDARAEATAAGAGDVLCAARVHEALEPALAGAGLVIGLTARARRFGAPALSPRECAERLAMETLRHPVALLFGREHSGLTNAELDRCQQLVHIPANPDYSSLNLAAAVQVMCYELRAKALDAPAPAEPVVEPASFEHLESFYSHLQRVMEKLDYAKHQPPEVMTRRLRVMINRARPEAVELDILRGLLAAMEKRLP